MDMAGAHQAWGRAGTDQMYTLKTDRVGGFFRYARGCAGAIPFAARELSGAPSLIVRANDIIAHAVHPRLDQGAPRPMMTSDVGDLIARLGRAVDSFPEAPVERIAALDSGSQLAASAAAAVRADLERLCGEAREALADLIERHGVLLLRDGFGEVHAAVDSWIDRIGKGLVPDRQFAACVAALDAALGAGAAVAADLDTVEERIPRLTADMSRLDQAGRRELHALTGRAVELAEALGDSARRSSDIAARMATLVTPFAAARDGERTG